jgi:hypothetical protein
MGSGLILMLVKPEQVTPTLNLELTNMSGPQLNPSSTELATAATDIPLALVSLAAKAVCRARAGWSPAWGSRSSQP